MFVKIKRKDGHLDRLLRLESKEYECTQKKLVKAANFSTFFTGLLFCIKKIVSSMSSLCNY